MKTNVDLLVEHLKKTKGIDDDSKDYFEKMASLCEDISKTGCLKNVLQKLRKELQKRVDSRFDFYEFSTPRRLEDNHKPCSINSNIFYFYTAKNVK